MYAMHARMLGQFAQHTDTDPGEISRRGALLYPSLFLLNISHISCRTSHLCSADCLDRNCASDDRRVASDQI
jgi:hypothetical protein